MRRVDLAIRAVRRTFARHLSNAVLRRRVDLANRAVRALRACMPGLWERGSAGVWVLALSGVLLLAGAASALAGMAMVGRHQAGAAADLAALAAASQALSGSEVACAQAGVIADANGAELDSCRLNSDGVVDVSVTVTVNFGTLGLGAARADARAGPAESTESAQPP